MTESQNWTFVDADNCVYQLMNVGNEQQFNNYSTLQTFLSDNQVILTDPSGNRVIDQELLTSENIFVDQDIKSGPTVEQSQIDGMTSIIEHPQEIVTIGGVSQESFELREPYVQPSTVLYVDDLKSENVIQPEASVDEEYITVDKSLKEEVVEVKNDFTTAPNDLHSDVNIKLPKNPKELLDTLMPILENNGGLRRSNQESFLKIMKSCDLMPLQCLLINIIRSSQASVLKKLLLMGGFDELHGWLKEARSQINKPLMLELLQLFKQLPVSTKLLRTNSCAKDIKQLIKNNDERISRFARVIVDDWMKIVSGSASTASKPKDTSKGATTTTTAASGAVKVSKPKVTKTAQPSSPKNHKAPEGNNHHKTEASSESPPSKNHHSSVKNDGEDKAVKAERPKTVKRRQYTSRMTGLEEDATFKSTKKNAATTTATTTAAATTATASALSGGPPDKNDLDANKSNFFDALQFNSSFLHRKRKASVAATTASTSKATSPTVATTTAATATTPLSVITTTATIAPATSPVLSEDDLSNVLPNFSYYKPVEDLEASKTSPEPTPTTATLPRLSPSAADDDTKPPAVKKLKKSVSWASDVSLCHFRFFEVDPTERCNVNTSNYFHDDNETFVDHRRHEFQMEKQLLQDWHSTQHAKPLATIEWRTPDLIDFEAPNDVVPGCESRERKVQLERESSVLQFIYFDKDTIAPFPSEPDAEAPSTETPQCKLIPLQPVEEEEEEAMETDQSLEHPSQDSALTPSTELSIKQPNVAPSNPADSCNLAPAVVTSAPVVLSPILSDMLNNVLHRTASSTSNSAALSNDSVVSNGNHPDLNDNLMKQQAPYVVNDNAPSFYSDENYEHNMNNNMSNNMNNNMNNNMSNNMNNNMNNNMSNSMNNNMNTNMSISMNNNNMNNGDMYGFDNQNNYNNNVSYDNQNFPNQSYNFMPYNAPFNPPPNNNLNDNTTNTPYNKPYNNDYNYNDAKAADPAFTTMPFKQSSSTPAYPIGFNQPPFDPSNQRPPFDGGRGFHHNRGRPRDFHNNFRHNGNFPPKKFNRNKNIDTNEVCRFFLQGKCMFGANCKKIHPSN